MLLGREEGVVQDARYDGLSVLRVPTADTAASREDVARCVEFIADVNSRGQSAVVSAPSVSSAGAVLAAYLVVAERKVVSEAIELVRDRRPGTMSQVTRSADDINYLLSLEWLCAARECAVFARAWVRKFGFTNTDLLSLCLSFVLAREKWARPSLIAPRLKAAPRIP